jgi:hypothetical protein
MKNFRRHFEHAKSMKEIFGKEEFPRFGRIYPAARDSVRADFRFFRSEGGSVLGFSKWFFPSLFWYLSAFSGLWVGTHLEKVPSRLRKRLPLQTSLIKK